MYVSSTFIFNQISTLMNVDDQRCFNVDSTNVDVFAGVCLDTIAHYFNISKTAANRDSLVYRQPNSSDTPTPDL